MQKRLCYIVVILGVGAIITAAAAIWTGSYPLYTAPAGIAGCGLVWFGTVGLKRHCDMERM